MNIRLIASVGALVAAFVAGASVTHIYDNNRYLKEKNAALEAVNEQHRREVNELAENSRRLASDLSDNRALLADRMREFEQWKLKHAGSKACQSERAIALAVRGEELLRRADSYLKALMR